MAEDQLLDLSNFMTLLEAQYASSPLGPADNPSRWAIVNSIIALAMRVKTAPGSEAALSDITHAFYQNAVKVTPELILQDPSLLSIQALLAMAMFAQYIPGKQAFRMLTTNASRQLEILSLSWADQLIGLGENEQYTQMYIIANRLSLQAMW